MRGSRDGSLHGRTHPCDCADALCGFGPPCSSQVPRVPAPQRTLLLSPRLCLNPRYLRQQRTLVLSPRLCGGTRRPRAAGGHIGDTYRSPRTSISENVAVDEAPSGPSGHLPHLLRRWGRTSKRALGNFTRIVNSPNPREFQTPPGKPTNPLPTNRGSRPQVGEMAVRPEGAIGRETVV